MVSAGKLGEHSKCLLLGSWEEYEKEHSVQCNEILTREEVIQIRRVHSSQVRFSVVEHSIRGVPAVFDNVS